jgi:hypothetical protein
MTHERVRIGRHAHGAVVGRRAPLLAALAVITALIAACAAGVPGDPTPDPTSTPLPRPAAEALGDEMCQELSDATPVRAMEMAYLMAERVEAEGIDEEELGAAMVSRCPDVMEQLFGVGDEAHPPVDPDMQAELASWVSVSFTECRTSLITLELHNSGPQALDGLVMIAFRDPSGAEEPGFGFPIQRLGPGETELFQVHDPMPGPVGATGGSEAADEDASCEVTDLTLYPTDSGSMPGLYGDIELVSDVANLRGEVPICSATRTMIDIIGELDDGSGGIAYVEYSRRPAGSARPGDEEHTFSLGIRDVLYALSAPLDDPRLITEQAGAEGRLRFSEVPALGEPAQGLPDSLSGTLAWTCGP